MNEEFRYQSAEVSSASPLVRVFSWMALALGITALTSFGMLFLLLSSTISPETYVTMLSVSSGVLFITYLWIIFSGMLRGRGNPTHSVCAFFRLDGSGVILPRLYV